MISENKFYELRNEENNLWLDNFFFFPFFLGSRTTWFTLDYRIMGQHWVTRNTWASSSHLSPRFRATWLAGSWWIDGVAVGPFACPWWWLESPALPQFFCHPVTNRSEKSREIEQGNERSLYRMNKQIESSFLLFSLCSFFFFFFLQMQLWPR